MDVDVKVNRDSGVRVDAKVKMWVIRDRPTRKLASPFHVDSRSELVSKEIRIGARGRGNIG